MLLVIQMSRTHPVPYKISVHVTLNKTGRTELMFTNNLWGSEISALLQYIQLFSISRNSILFFKKEVYKYNYMF